MLLPNRVSCGTAISKSLRILRLVSPASHPCRCNLWHGANHNHSDLSVAADADYGVRPPRLGGGHIGAWVSCNKSGLPQSVRGGRARLVVSHGRIHRPTSTPTRGTLLHKAGPRRESGSGGRDSRRAGAEKQTMSCERIAISQLAYSDRNDRPVPAVPVMVSSKPHAFGMDAGSRGALVLSDCRARVHCGKPGSRFWLRHGTASMLLEHQRRLHIFSSRALGGLPSRGLACWDVPDRRRDRSEHGATCIASREGDTATFTRAPGSNSDRLWSEAWAVRAMPDCTAYWDLRKGTAANIVGTGRAISGVAGVAVNR